jgi:hypothetical protein
MALHVVAADELPGQPVGAPLKCYHVVPDEAGDIDALMQPPIAAIVIEAIFECLANGGRIYHASVPRKPEGQWVFPHRDWRLCCPNYSTGVHCCITPGAFNSSHG